MNMKELSIEEKVKAYDEALKKAKDMLSYKEVRREDMEYLFPELKESEDERIRKELITHCRNTRCVTEEGAERIAKWLAWLEKQGEQKHKIKPKFKIGDIIRFKGNETLKGEVEAHKIVGYDNELYVFADGTTDLFCEQDLYELVEQKDFAPKVEPKFKVKYAGSEYNVFEVKDIAGVRFYGIEDEPNHIDYVKAENCEIISGYAIKENGSPYPTKPAMFSEQKPAWSEEDENILDAITYTVKNSGYKHCIGVSNEMMITFIKSLKDRVQPKQEWNEEDESYLNTTIAYLKDAKEFKKTAENCMDWLKSLKDRVQSTSFVYEIL